MKKKIIRQILMELLLWQNPHTPLEDKIKWGKSKLLKHLIEELPKRKKVPKCLNDSSVGDYERTHNVCLAEVKEMLRKECR